MRCIKLIGLFCTIFFAIFLTANVVAQQTKHILIRRRNRDFSAISDNSLMMGSAPGKAISLKMATRSSSKVNVNRITRSIRFIC